MHIEDGARERGALRAAVSELVRRGLHGSRRGADRASAALSRAASRGHALAEAAGAWLRRRSPLRHGRAAAKRGNLEAALALLKEAAEREVEQGESALELWKLALSMGRAEEAAAELARQIHTEASAGQVDVAVDHWIELAEHAPAQRADAPTLVRMLPELRRRLAAALDADERARAEGRLLRALRQSVEPEASQLTTGLALRVFAQARLLDPEAARRAGELVLSARDLHETKRREVETLLEELEAAAAPEPPETGGSSGAEAGLAPPYGTLCMTEVLPVELRDRGLIVQETGGAERTRIDLRNVAVIAAACIGEEDAKTPLLIDLVLRRTPRARGRRIVRMHADAFDARSVLEGLAGSEDPSRGLLEALVEESGAVALLEAGAAGEPGAAHFPSVDAYEGWLLSHLDAGRPGVKTSAGRPGRA